MTDQTWPAADGDTRIKICGLRDPEMAAIAIDAGASAIGLVRHEPSPRHVDDQTVAAIQAVIPSPVASVQVFVDPPPPTVRETAGWIQLHGEETEDLVAMATGPVVRGFSFSPDAVRRWDQCPDVKILLIDGPGKGAGRGFDHEALLAMRDELTTPIVIAGGLCPDSVGPCIETLRPWGVDVSSGVESERGVKDPGRIRAFCEAVRAADQANRT
ncbi:MAG: phosphoribosylanthranilate isomerase [Phycisphaerales bacterium]|nr:phosphoribosylanthranilate isomerase [Phycisphaerales bacterium]